MDPRILGVMAGQHGLITFPQARRLGMTDRETATLVRRGRWLRVRQSVYVDADTWAALDDFRGRPMLRVRAAHLVLRSPHWFSHESAALIHGLPLGDPATAGVHVSRPDVLGGRTKAGITHHHAAFDPRAATTVTDLPVLDLARTACDLARGSGVTAGLAAIDRVLRRGISRAELDSVRQQMAGWRGVRDVETALRLADPGAENYAESAMRELVHTLGIGWPETQFGLRAEGRTVFCDLRVGRHVFEFDGAIKYTPVSEGGVAHNEAREVLLAEKRRQDFLTGFKLGVSRVTYRDLGAGRASAVSRLRREYGDTVARWGNEVSDLAPYVVSRRP